MIPLTLGLGLDLLLGDPHWLPHPVRLLGWLIDTGEKRCASLFPTDPQGQQWAGCLLVILVVALSAAGSALLLWGARWVSPYLATALATWMCYQLLAVKSLKDESMKVYQALIQADLPKARYQVSRIVGRDTEQLTEAQVAKAAIETVAENTCDGVVAPLFYLILGGPVLGFVYKAINTMDSMIGYKNQRYLYLGRCAARLDDVANYLPARLAAFLLLGAAALLGLDSRRGWVIFRRDRYNHASPNSAQTESVCAGVLGIQLAGDAWYFGKRHMKPTIGDAREAVKPGHIPQTNRLMYGAAGLALLLGWGWYGVWAIIRGGWG